jgi:hypothetical protein
LRRGTTPPCHDIRLRVVSNTLRVPSDRLNLHILMRSTRTLAVLGLALLLGGLLVGAVVPETGSPDDNLVCSDGPSGSCYAKYVKALPEEFVSVLPGQIVDSNGLPVHVKMNLETGFKEVKLMGNEAGKPSDIVVAPTQEMLEFGAASKPSEPTEKVVFHNNDTARKDDQTRPKLSLEEKWAFEGFADAVLNWKDGELLGLLQDLEDTVHHIDFGLTLASSQYSLEKLVELLEHEDSGIRGQAAVVLGSTFSNNPAAQAKAIGSQFDIVESMVATIQKEKDETVLKRLLYAVAVLIRGNANGCVKFLDARGLAVLSEAAEAGSDVIVKRALNIFADLWDSAQPAGEYAEELCGRWRSLVGTTNEDPELSRRLAPVCKGLTVADGDDIHQF